jgi:hypothetical protein
MVKQKLSNVEILWNSLLNSDKKKTFYGPHIVFCLYA